MASLSLRVSYLTKLPYVAIAEPSLPSALQIAVDHGLLATNMTIILAGSNEGFMESEVLGRKSPLYGRRTAQIRLCRSITLTQRNFFLTRSRRIWFVITRLLAVLRTILRVSINPMDSKITYFD